MKSKRNDQLWNALTRVKMDAQKAMESAQHQLELQPLHGWSIEKHKAYHEREIAEAQAVVHYCFIRQMQIDPD